MKNPPDEPAGVTPERPEKELEPEREVTNVRVEQKVGKIRLDWDLDAPGVSHIELLGKYRKDPHFWKIEGYARSVRAVDLELLPLAPIEIVIHLVFRDGAWSKGKSIKTHALHKNVIEDEVEGRTIHVYLPDGYGEEETQYPVIYMHDGQNLFCEKLAFVEHWEIDKAVERLVGEKKMGKVVVVGIFNSSRRAEEYTPFADRRFSGGQARDFSQFIVEKIIPHVETRYRVSRLRKDRAVMGSSFGGILSLWMGYAYPDVFSMVGAISPSLWIADGAMLEELELQPKRDIKIWIDQGTREWSTFTRNTVNILLQKGYKYGEELIYYEVKDAPHNEVAWAARIDNPFILFNGKPATRCVDMRLDVQFIRIFDVGPVEVVINPIGIFDNGTWYSLYTTAEYSMSTPDQHISLPLPPGPPPIGKDTRYPASATGLAKTSAAPRKESPAPKELRVTATIDCTGVLQFNEDRIATVVVKYGNLLRKITVQNPNPPPEPPELGPKPAESKAPESSPRRTGDARKKFSRRSH
ncbi:MAG: alpha/beta hydrolase [Armatimonadetes bacterium]|nr:alpha/beta hydrolase [Armatimonadota bacterium]